MELIKGNVKIEWDYIGEGLSGEYNPDNPDDIELLRFYVSVRDSEADDWRDVEDASYCTNFSADSSDAVQMKALEIIMNRVYDKVIDGAPIKKICEELSYLSETDIKKEAHMPKYVDTPVGKFEMPSWEAERLDKMTDIELLDEYVEKCKNFIDPFLFQEMADRKLIHAGDYYADILIRLEQMKNDVILDQAADDLSEDDELEP